MSDKKIILDPNKPDNFYAGAVKINAIVDEVVQASTEIDGTVHTTLPERLNAEATKFNNQIGNLSKKTSFFVTPDMFGAKGDWNGTTGTDDTASIQQALDTGMIVHFNPETYYKISDTLIVSKPTVIDLNGATIIQTVAAWKEIFCVTADDVTIRNGVLDATTHGYYGINIVGTDNLNRHKNYVFENLIIKNIRTWTPNPVNGTGSAINLVWVDHAEIKNVKMYNIDGFGVSLGRCRYVDVDNCYAENIYGHGYSFSGEDYTSEYCNLTNSHAVNTGYAGIDLEGGSHCSVKNNTFKNIGRKLYPTGLGGGNLQSAIVLMTAIAYEIHVEGNKIYDAAYDGIWIAQSTDAGATVDGVINARKNLVINNTIEKCERNGITTSGNENQNNDKQGWKVRGNIIKNVYIGILMGWVSKVSDISGNTVIDCAKGIVGSGVTLATINGNTIEYATNVGIEMTGISNSVLSGNVITKGGSVNGFYGINLDNSADPLNNVSVNGNTITGMMLVDDEGIRIYAAGQWNYVNVMGNAGIDDIFISLLPSAQTFNACTLIHNNKIFDNTNKTWKNLYV